MMWVSYTQPHHVYYLSREGKENRTTTEQRGMEYSDVITVFHPPLFSRRPILLSFPTQIIYVMWLCVTYLP